MTDLFLQCVELSNFRVYGDSYAFDFDPKPGITLIVGANGLGKTTLFDGIEWALTGQVSRFSEVPVDGRRKERDPLTRLGQPEGSHRVGLIFSDGAPIDRGQGLDPAETDIAGLLRHPGWSEISDLHRYLSITHFLGQAASMRFSVRSPKQQWEALKGPAEVDRINYAKERLGGQAARQAFTRVIREASNRLSELNTSYASWQQLLAERDRLVQLSASEDALSPEELILAVNDLARRLVDMTPGVRWNDAVAAEASEAQLSRLATLSAAAEDRARADQNRLQALETRAVEYSAVVADIVAQSEMVAQTERRLREVSEAAAAVEPAITRAEDAVAANRRQVTDAQSQVGVLSRAAVAAEQLANAERALQSTLARLEISDRTVEAGQGRRAQASERLAAAIEQVERRGRLSAQLSDARRRVELTEQWTVLRTEVSRLTARSETIDPITLRARRDEVIVERTAADAEAAGLSAQLRLLDERTAAMAEAVAAIASHLTHDDTDCPVCATPFAVGELLKLARARPAERSSVAFALADAFAAAEVRRSTAVTSLREIETALTDFIQVQAMIAEQRSAEQALLQQLAEVGATGTASPDVADARKAVEGLEIEMQRLDAQIEALGSVEVIRGEHQDAIAALEAEATRRVELIRRQAEYSANADTARAVLRQTPELWNPDGGFVVDLQSAIEAVRTQFDTASRQQVQLQAVLDDLRQELEALRSRGTAEEGALLAANTRLRQSGDRRKELAAAWEGAGLSGDPDAARLTTQMAIATDRLTGVTQLGERQKRLSASYRRWLDDEALRDVERRIGQRLVGDGGPEEVTARLVRQAQAAQARLDQAERSRAQMDQVVTGMQAKADDYARNVLQPLNDTIHRFSRSLMGWSDSAIVYNAEHHATRAELRPSAVRTERDGSTSVLDINPNRFFSEGQLSALSVSALLAASTSFRWSRWRGLLMDDPLQHNDVIHASAFMDLMRQLVRRLDYQVIMSTHDSAEAAFLIRKCESAGIPLRVHELQPSGGDGLVSAVA